MKKLLLSVALFLSLGITAWAQVPQQFNYQGIARTAAGAPLTSTVIGLRLTVHEGSATGSVDYQETQNASTNNFGLYNVFIGDGLVNTAGGGAASLGAVVWGTGLKYLQVEIDPAGGTNYLVAGTAQLLSVPYALYAGNSPATGVTNVATGVGLAGGPITSTGTISLTDVGTAGTYGSGTTVPKITTDAQGRVTSVVNTPITAGAGTITSITAGTGLAGGTITASGTISMPPVGTPGIYGSGSQIPVITTDAEGRVSNVLTTPVTAVTSVTAGTGLAGGTITSAGSLSLGTAGTPGLYGSSTMVPVFTTDAYGRVISVTNTPITVAGSGTVTSVTAGAGLSGGTITTTGTVSMPTVGTAGTYGSATTYPVITTDPYGRVTAVTVNPLPAGGGGGITSTGTANYIAKFTSPTAIANSGMYNTPAGQVGLGTITPIATYDVESTTDTMIGFFASTSAAPSVNVGVLTSEYQGFTDQGIALEGNANNNLDGNNTFGVQGIGTAIGMQGIGASEQVSGFASVRGVEGDGLGDDQYAMGVGAYATPDVGFPLTCYGIVGNATGGLTNYSGYFVGDVSIGGTMTAVTKAFKMDHPLDPANKYLYHSCVESNDMMDIYNGNITTDATGTATVSLPSYFEALNKDFRYQLTVIGSFAQAMVSKEVAGNQFEIKTNQPDTKVSWQVTGIRHDAYANAHPIVPEVEKESYNKGKYMTPQVFGKPESDMIGYDIAHPSKNAAQAAKKTTTENKTQK